MNDREILLNKLATQIDDAARRFAPIYKLLNWKWDDSNGTEPYVPDALRISKTIKRLFEHVRDSESPDTACCSGGLRVWIEGYEAGISFEDDISIHL